MRRAASSELRERDYPPSLLFPIFLRKSRGGQKTEHTYILDNFLGNLANVDLGCNLGALLPTRCALLNQRVDGRQGRNLDSDLGRALGLIRGRIDFVDCAGARIRQSAVSLETGHCQLS